MQILILLHNFPFLKVEKEEEREREWVNKDELNIVTNVP